MLDTQNQGPQCTACGSPMRLAAIEPSTLGQDLRTFTCPRCKRAQRYIIDSAVTEAWVAPKALRPPQLAAENCSRPGEPLHGLYRQIRTGGLHCPVSTQRR
jgi:hypothetical protein